MCPVALILLLSCSGDRRTLQKDQSLGAQGASIAARLARVAWQPREGALTKVCVVGAAAHR
jgi:hypothetical protein